MELLLFNPFCSTSLAVDEQVQVQVPAKSLWKLNYVYVCGI